MTRETNNPNDHLAGDNKKVLLAMSGGVDSSVAAKLLQEQGYEVTGVFMSRGSDFSTADKRDIACGSQRDATDAQRVADALGIQLCVLDLHDRFTEIIDYFVAEYVAGRTPNPCIMCNMKLKFGRLLELADSLGCARMATGHYARIVQYAGSPAIARGLSAKKDQSYALFGIQPAVLDRIILPVGEIDDKARVREIAKSLGLEIHDKPDSQDICFIDGTDYTKLLAERAPQALTPGRIINTAGEELGRHEGYGRYTIGQRRGLGVAMGEPAYVTKIDPVTADVTLGSREESCSRFLRAERANWHHRPAQDSFDAIVQIRYNNRGAPARVTQAEADDEKFDVEFSEPVHAITPGQAAVVYDGNVVLGGGWIA